MNYYNEIKERLIDNEIYLKVKDYSKERHNVIMYYEVGELLFKAGNTYGEDIVGKYSEKLVTEVGKKYNCRTLRRMRQLYLFFERQKWSPQGTKLSVSHIRELFCLKDGHEIDYYVSICIKKNLTRNELREKIKNNEYQRIPIDAREQKIKNEKTEYKDFIPNPIIIKNNNYNVVSEKVLQKLVLENIESFMRELGNDFCFIGSQYKIKIGERYNYIDLLLFNLEYNCFVVVELKVTELKKEHIGQIEIYMNYIDNNLRKITQDKTIGIIICKKENKYIIEYCSDKRIISRKYELL